MELKKTYLAVKQRNRRILLDISEVVYIEAEGNNYVALHTVEKKQVFHTRGTIKEMLVKTAGHCYLRIHHGILANMAFLKGFSSETNFQAAGGKLLLKPDTELPVSRSYHAAVLNYMKSLCL